MVERCWIGGSCPNIACMPSKNEIANAKVAHLARHGAEHGVVAESITVDIATVRRRKRELVKRQIAAHLQNYKASGAELIMGNGRFVAPKTLEVRRCKRRSWQSCHIRGSPMPPWHTRQWPKVSACSSQTHRLGRFNKSRQKEPHRQRISRFYTVLHAACA